MITGATGFIGANLAHALLLQGAIVHAIIRPRSDTWRISKLMNTLNRHTADLDDFRSVEECFSKASPDYVFNLAINHGHPLTSADRQRYFMEATTGMINIIESLKERKFQKLVHIGGSLEYRQSHLPITESSPIDPFSFRGVTKAAQAMICKQYAKEFGLPVCIVRPFSVYGTMEAQHRFIPTLMKSALNGASVTLTEADARHDFIHVDDVVRAILLAAESSFTTCEAFNAGCGREYSNQEVLALVKQVTGRQLTLSEQKTPLRIHDTPHWVADTTLSTEKLGFISSLSLEEGLKNTWTWFRQYHGGCH